MTTIKGLYNELSRWIAFKWKTANFGGDLPSPHSLSQYMQSLIKNEAERDAGAYAVKKANERRRAAGVKETSAPLFILSMMDYRFDYRTEDTDKNDPIALRIVTKIDKDVATILLFSLNTTKVKMTVEADDLDDEDDLEEERKMPKEKIILAVKSIGFDGDGSKTIGELFDEACSIQDSIGFDINERWMRQDEWFRYTYQICPQCGALLERDHEYRKHKLVCHCCDWESLSKYEDRSDLGNLDKFRREIKFIARVNEFCDKRTALFDELNHTLDQLDSLYEKQVHGFSDSYYMRVHMEKVIEHCQKLIEATKQHDMKTQPKTYR